MKAMKKKECVLTNMCSLTILDVSLVTIGDRVQIGPNVSIYSAAHDTSILSRMKCEEYGLPVTIEDDCWIGGGTIILAGVTIGSGTTVGAGSIVTKELTASFGGGGQPCQGHQEGANTGGGDGHIEHQHQRVN